MKAIGLSVGKEAPDSKSLKGTETVQYIELPLLADHAIVADITQSERVQI